MSGFDLILEQCSTFYGLFAEYAVEHYTLFVLSSLVLILFFIWQLLSRSANR